MSIKYLYKTLFCTSLMLLLLTSQIVSAGTLKSTVDRYRIGEDETVNLVISLDDASFSGSPDLAGLDSNFDILNSSTSSSTQIINGSISSKKEWHLVLSPKKIGKLLIPSFKIKDTFSDAIEIEVLNRSSSQDSNNADNTQNQQGDLFLEQRLDKKEAYVQERVTLTLRIYTAVEIARPEIPDPVIADFMVEKLGESEYQSKQNGRNYYVLEYRYALFANKSGKVVLPKQRYQINQIVHNRSRSMFDFPGFDTTDSQPRLLSSPEATLTIKPQSDNLTAPYWLPSEDVSISDNWKDQQHVDVGVPLTRSIEIKALGSLAAHIPPLTVDNIPGLKSYAEQPELNNSRAGENLVGTRKENIAIVPTQPGTYILPAITIHWFDTKTKQFRTSSIPERTLTVSGGANTTTPDSMPTPTIRPQQDTASNTAQPLNLRSADTISPDSKTPFYLNPYLWIAVAILFLLFWIVTIILLIKSKNNTNTTLPASSIESARLQSIKEAFKQLKNACTENDAKKSREALISWATLQWQDAHIQTLVDVKNRINTPAFNKLADELDSSLYRETAFWNGKTMLDFLQSAKLSRSTNDRVAKLPELYE